MRLRRASAAGSGGDFHYTLHTRTGRRFQHALLVSTLEDETPHRDAFRLLGIRELAERLELPV